MIKANGPALYFTADKMNQISARSYRQINARVHLADKWKLTFIFLFYTVTRSTKTAGDKTLLNSIYVLVICPNSKLQ